MPRRWAGVSVLAGLAAQLVVRVVATELGSAAGIEFSLFVGIPAGLVAGAAAAAVVFVRFEYPDPARRRGAVALAGFGATFVVALIVAVGALRLRNSSALPVAAVVGLVGSVVGLARDRRA